jgi:hypothetical protein
VGEVACAAALDIGSAIATAKPNAIAKKRVIDGNEFIERASWRPLDKAKSIRQKK